MTPACLSVILFFCRAFQEPEGIPQVNPIAPSLPALTDAEESRLDDIVERFMRYDTGKLGGAAGAQALEDFQKLGNEAIPALLRGLRKSAELDHSCPVTVIAKKLRGLLVKSEDRELLSFARDEISAIDSIRYRGLLTDLRVQITQRSTYLDRAGIVYNPLAKCSVEELNRRIRAERRLKTLGELGLELSRRKEQGAAEGLGLLATSSYPEIRKKGEGLLGIWMQGRNGEQAATLLTHSLAPVRLEAALRLIRLKDPKADAALELLKDPVTSVREQVHQVLVQLAGKDIADPGNSVEEQAKAVAAWLGWWRDHGMR